jgi:hypothetical protein
MHAQSGSEFLDGDVPVKYLLGSFGQIDHLGYSLHVVTGGMPGAVARLDLVPSENIASAVLANSDGVDLWALQHEIFADLLPAFRDIPYKPPPAAETGAGEKFDPPEPLLGVWKGSIRTPVKNISAALSFLKGSDVTLEIDGRKYSPLSVKTELGDMTFKDGAFSGLFWGRIETPDTAGMPHVVHISVRLRENSLEGSASAVSADGRRTFFLPHWIDLARSGPAERPARPVSVLILLGEWFGDAYFSLKEEIEARGWTMKRVGVDVEYRGCYNKKRDIVLRSDILIPDLEDFSGYDCLIIPSGPQFRKFKENQTVLKFVRDAHAAGLLVASFCTGNSIVKAAGLIDFPSGPALFPEKVALVRERVLLGPRGGGPPPGNGFESAPIKEICDAIARELAAKKRPQGTLSHAPQGTFFRRDGETSR